MWCTASNPQRPSDLIEPVLPLQALTLRPQANPSLEPDVSLRGDPCDVQSGGDHVAQARIRRILHIVAPAMHGEMIGVHGDDNAANRTLPEYFHVVSPDENDPDAPDTSSHPIPGSITETMVGRS